MLKLFVSILNIFPFLHLTAVVIVAVRDNYLQFPINLYEYSVIILFPDRSTRFSGFRFW